MNDRPHYPWSEGDALFASELNAAIANAGGGEGGGAVNVITYGADPTGVADSTASFRAALANKIVHAPAGTFRITGQIVVGAGQVLYGAGRGATVLVIDTDFSHTDTGVISLTGREALSPIVRDLRISFAQTSTQGVRANFRTLAAGGNLTTGIMYPPAIIITSSNRFRLSGVAVEGAWDGIVNSASNGSIGGYFINDIEMGALNVGLWIDNAFDTGHIKGWHSWCFGLGGGAVYTGVYLDGNTFAAKFGVNGNAQAVLIEDFFTLEGAISIDNSNSWVQFVNLGLDGNGARVIVNNCLHAMITNVYTSPGPNTNPQFSMAAGLLFITSQTGGGWINHTGGELVLNSINPSAQQTNIPLIRQTGGFLRVSNSYLVMPGGLGAWTTVPAIQSTGGTIVFENNFLSPMPPGSTQPGLFISTDNASHVVQGNFLNGWSWTPPGSLGSYGLNSDGHSRQSVQFAAVQVKSPAGGPTGMGMVANSGQQRALVVNTGNELDPASYRWQWIFGTNAAETGANAGTNFLLYRYDDTGNVLGTPALTITRSNGEFFVDRLKMNTFGLNIATPVGRQTVTGSRASGAALVSLLNAMAAFGLILDSTTA